MTSKNPGGRVGNAEPIPKKFGLSATLAVATPLLFPGTSMAEPEARPVYPQGLKLLTGKELANTIKGTVVRPVERPFRGIQVSPTGA